ncbi:tetraspanin-7-like isoform X1 [Trifolium pratense]|uniref:tetraspanin-7-like isoform X1 n=1 Tax=Trifolium pratense TaxID=57577 RepID=UPI001E6924D5|nr:tetraspanin-7-like isoform X1 [Trifolium pratense]
MKFSNILVGIMNFLTLILSIAMLCLAVWLPKIVHTDQYDKWLQKPFIALGVFLLVVSLMGFIGACCRVSWVLLFYLFVMFLLIILIFIFTIFAIVVTNKGVGVHSNWLVNDRDNWNTIKSSLQIQDICKLPNQHLDDTSHLSSLEIGCCMPSNECGFTKKIENVSYVDPNCAYNKEDCGVFYYNQIIWTKTENVTYTNSDCNAWNNDPNALCFNCQSCKDGFLQDSHIWKKLVDVNIVILIFLVIVCFFGCCAIRNNRCKGGNRPGQTKFYKARV